MLRNRTCTVRYVENMEGHLLLRSHDPSSHIEVLPMAEGKKPGDYLVGRVCHIAHEV